MLKVGNSPATGEDDAAAREQQQAHSQKAQELLNALNIVNAHNYIVRQDPDGSTRTPERVSASELHTGHAVQTPSDLDGDSSGSEDGESTVSQQASPEVSIPMQQDFWA